MQPFDAVRVHRLLSRYPGLDKDSWDPRFRDTLAELDYVFVRIKPEAAVTHDVSYEAVGERRYAPSSEEIRLPGGWLSSSLDTHSISRD